MSRRTFLPANILIVPIIPAHEFRAEFRILGACGTCGTCGTCKRKGRGDSSGLKQAQIRNTLVTVYLSWETATMRAVELKFSGWAWGLGGYRRQISTLAEVGVPLTLRSDKRER